MLDQTQVMVTMDTVESDLLTMKILPQSQTWALSTTSTNTATVCPRNTRIDTKRTRNTHLGVVGAIREFSLATLECVLRIILIWENRHTTSQTLRTGRGNPNSRSLDDR